MTLKQGYGKDTIAVNIRALMQESFSWEQAVTIAHKEARKCYWKKYPSGFLPPWIYPDRNSGRNNPNKLCGTNPVPPSSKVQLRKAQELYENFTGHKGNVIARIDKPKIPDTLACIGDIDGIMYSTVRDGKFERYIHEFKDSARPLFCVAPDGQQLFMIGGSYDFTERGIVDRTGRKRKGV